jgi:TnpA family transposase
MSEDERLFGSISTLYAYGCNSGPTQASQATGLRKQAILYMRRHYMGIRQLVEAASILVDAYKHTAMSQYLGDPRIFMTDSMRFPTLRDSLTARPHFRDPYGKNVLLYQDVANSCICFFTQALLCNVSEGIHMISGVLKQQSSFDPGINICDSGGRSDLVLGLVLPLNMEVWARPRSRQKIKLWSPDENLSCSKIDNAIAGVIRWEIIDQCWQDMVWVLASIADGKADPSVILERLNSQPKHPATLGFSELGKANRSIYLVWYGMDMALRRIVIRCTSQRESWNQFARDAFYGYGGLVREKSQEGQEEIFWFLTVIQNAIVLWNALALEQAIKKARQDGVKIEDEDLRHILPTMLEHINFVGQFNLDLKRQPPFRLVV